MGKGPGSAMSRAGGILRAIKESPQFQRLLNKRMAGSTSPGSQSSIGSSSLTGSTGAPAVAGPPGPESWKSAILAHRKERAEQEKRDQEFVKFLRQRVWVLGRE